MAANPRVLVVDDEPAIVTIVSAILAKRGYQVIAATSPREALDRVNREGPMDVVVSDVMMPEITGPELVRRVQDLSPSTGAVFMSGYPADRQLPPAIPFVRKPFSPAEMVAAVERVLRESRELQEASRRVREGSRKLRSDSQQLRERVSRLGKAAAETRSQSKQICDGAPPKKPESSDGSEHS